MVSRPELLPAGMSVKVKAKKFSSLVKSMSLLRQNKLTVSHLSVWYQLDTQKSSPAVVLFTGPNSDGYRQNIPPHPQLHVMCAPTSCKEDTVSPDTEISPDQGLPAFRTEQNKGHCLRHMDSGYLLTVAQAKQGLSFDFPIIPCGHSLIGPMLQVKNLSMKMSKVFLGKYVMEPLGYRRNGVARVLAPG